LIHWPVAAEKTDDNTVKLGTDGKYMLNCDLTRNLEPTWHAMEKLYKAGKSRSIGVSNWTVAGLEAMFQYAEIKPAINQIEIHPFLPNNEVVDYCFAHNILPVAYSPLGSQGQVPSTGEKMSTNRELNTIAKKCNASLAQVLIAWGLKRGYAVLPMSSNESRIRENFHVIDLDDAQFQAVNQVAEGRHSRFVNLKDTFGYDVWADEA